MATGGVLTLLQIGLQLAGFASLAARALLTMTHAPTLLSGFVLCCSWCACRQYQAKTGLLRSVVTQHWSCAYGI